MVDSSKPILAQVGRLGRDYSRWLHTPEPVLRPRFFANPLLEAVTATEWWVVPLVWVPFIAWGLARAESQRRAGGGPLTLLLAGLALGVALWQCLEYAVHRFVFHKEPCSAWGVTVHFTLHGCHHKFPLDRGRLVFPPLPAAACAAGLRAACRATLPRALVLPTFLGILVGYLTYDCLHYAMHQGVGRRWPLLKQVRAAHMGHHFRDPDHGFGITSPLLDVLLGTLPPQKQDSASQTTQ